MLNRGFGTATAEKLMVPSCCVSFVSRMEMLWKASPAPDERNRTVSNGNPVTLTRAVKYEKVTGLFMGADQRFDLLVQFSPARTSFIQESLPFRQRLVAQCLGEDFLEVY
jgi:hypothetical protein